MTVWQTPSENTDWALYDELVYDEGWPEEDAFRRATTLRFPLETTEREKKEEA